MKIQNGGINPENTMLSTQRTPLYNGLCETEKDDSTVHARWRRPVTQYWTEKVPRSYASGELIRPSAQLH